MKVFIAMPYSQLCDENYMLKPKYKDFCIKLTNEIKNIGWEYFLAHERENWGKEYSSAEESTLIDFETIKNSDLIVSIPDTSGGVHVELGWASANKKIIKIFLNENKSYSPMVLGMNVLTDTEYFYYGDEYSKEIIDQIIKILIEFNK